MGDLAPDQFYADYPLWTLYDENLVQGGDTRDGFPQLNIPGAEPILVIFTDPDLAERFTQAIRRPDLEVMALREPDAALSVAEYFQKRGIKHVWIDTSFRPTTALIIPIAEFIGDIRRGASPPFPT